MAGRVAWLLLILPALARADDDALVGVGTADVPIGYVNVKDPWIDRLHQGVFNAVWRSAMRVDQWFGSTADENAYMQTSGSIAPSLLYDEFDGFQPRLRFQVDVPLPRLTRAWRPVLWTVAGALGFFLVLTLLAHGVPREYRTGQQNRAPGCNQNPAFHRGGS